MNRKMNSIFFKRIVVPVLSVSLLLLFAHSSVDAIPRNLISLYPAQSDYQEISSMESGWRNYYQTGMIYYDDFHCVEGNTSLAMQTDTRDGKNTVGASLSFSPITLETRALRFFVRSTNWENVEQLGVLMNSSGVWFDMFAVDIKPLMNCLNNNEWIEVVLSRSEFYPLQNPSWASINQIMFRLISRPDTEPTVWVDHLGHFESAKKPILSIVFDDGMSVIYDHALPVFEDYGVRGSCFIIPDFVGLEQDGFMSQKQIDFLAYRYGWGIGGHDWMNLVELPLEHSPNDPSWLPTLDESLQRNQSYFKEHPYPGKDCYAIPYGLYNDKVIETISKYYTYVRPHNNLSQPSGYICPYNINSHIVYAGLPIEEIQRWIQNAKENHDWVILVMHRIVPNPSLGIETENSVEFLQQILDYALNIEEVEVLPFHEALEEYFPPAG
jgi:peptidoglycan/xylan/chitin deacetylase (PgdA/CDA1 family)